MNDDYKNLYNGAPVGLWRTSIDTGKFLQANEATVNILGFRDFDDLSQYVSTDLYDQQARTNLIKELEEVQEISDFHVVMTRKDGRQITVSVSAKIHPDKGYLEGTIRDVSGVISLEAASLIPHLEKMSLLKKHILERVNGECCDSHPLLHRTAKIA
jgi:PAS domain S-box-containing protein